MAFRSAASSIISTRARWRPRSGSARRSDRCSREASGRTVLGGERGKMAACLQPREQQEARDGGCGANRKKPEPADGFGDEACAGRQIGAADGGKRGEQRVLRRRVQRVVAQRRQI